MSFYFLNSKEVFFYLFALVSAFSISGSTVLLSFLFLIYFFRFKENLKKTPLDFLYFVFFYIWRGLSLVLNGYFLGFFKAFGDIWDKTPYVTSSIFDFDERVIKRFINLLLWTNTIIFIYALCQKYLDFPIIVKQLFTADWVRFKGYHSHPLRFAGYLSTVFLIAFSFGIFYSKKYLYMSFVLFISVVLNGSRSYLLSVFVVISLLCFIGSIKRTFYIFGVLILFLGASYFIFPELSVRVKASFDNDDNKISHMSLRMNFWKAGFEISQKSPIYGIGAKNLPKYLEEYKNRGLIDNVAHCHNVYISYLAEGGVIGLGLILFIFVYFIRKYFLIGYYEKDDFKKAFAFSLFGCWLNVAISGIFETNFSTFSLWSLLSLWMGMFEGYKNNNS